MFGLFGKKKPKPAPLALSPLAQASAPPPPAATPAVATDEDEARERLLRMILVGLSDDRGVSVETALVTLGGLAGFSAQMAVRAGLIATGRIPEDKALMKVECANGDVFYTGDILNPPLLETAQGQTSIYRMTAEAVFALGVKTFPDIGDMVGRMARSYGEDSYGMPRVPAANLPRHPPRALLRDSWDIVAAYLKLQDKGDPLIWPYWLGTVIQKLVRQAAGAIDPSLIMPLVMETALAMSRVDPKTIVDHSRHDGPRAIDLARTDLGKLLQSPAFGDALARAKAEAKA